MAEGGNTTLPGLGNTPAFADTVASSEESVPRVELGATLVRGETIGRFVVLDVLGTGGVGVVYAAYDPNLDRKVAIKLLRGTATGSEDARLRLLREAQAMARIDHPNVLRVHEAGTRGEQIYIAMEFAGGGTVRSWLAHRRATRDIVAVFVQAGRGLAAAHAAGLVHRDFKPDNVLMFDGGQARVTDFGLVGLVGEQAPAVAASRVDAPIDETTPLSRDLTRTGAVMGTPAYMAPEQFQGGAVGRAADQFAFCVALYDALYGERPFAGTTFAELCANVISGELRAPPRDADVSPRLRRLLLRGLATDPAKRFPSLDALLAELSRDPRKRTRVVLAAAGALALAGAAAWLVLRPAPGACGGASERLAVAWNPVQRERLAVAFAASHRPDAQAVLGRVAPMIDKWSETWEQGYVGACEDTRVHQVQSEHLLDLRMECLARKLDEVHATIDVLADGGGEAVDRAVSVAQALPPVDPCADSVGLVSDVAPPATAGARWAVAALRAQLDHAAAEEKVGHFAKALTIAQSALTAARTAGDQPSIAEATYEVGLVEIDLDDPSSVETTFAAMRAALAAGRTELAVLAASRAVIAVSDHTTSYELGDQLGSLAEALSEHTHVSTPTSLDLERALGLLDTPRRPKQAQDRLEHALALAKAQLGPDDATTIAVLTTLGNLYRREGRYSDARAVFEQALASTERTAGPDHPDVANILDNLAYVYLDEHKPGDVKHLIDRALAIRIAALGPDHIDITRSYISFGAFYRLSGDNATAKTYLEKALVRLEQAYGPDSFRLDGVLQNLGASLHDLGDDTAARALLDRDRANMEKAYGPDSPRLADLLGILAAVAGAQHRLDESLALYQRAEHMSEELYGPDSPKAARFLGNMVNTLRKAHKLDEARDVSARAIAKFTNVYGHDSFWVGATLINDAGLHAEAGDFQHSLASSQEALAIFEKLLGKDNPQVAAPLVAVSESLISLQRQPEAVVLLERALAIGAGALNPNQEAEAHFDLAHALVANRAMRARARTEAKTAFALYQHENNTVQGAKVQTWLKKQSLW